jgi:hypothetical protein
MDDRLSASRESTEVTGKRRLPGTRRLLAALSFVAVAAAMTLVLVPAASTRGEQDSLKARVVASTRGPLPPCDGVGIPCTIASTVQYFVYVANNNELANVQGSFRTRATLVNSFVIDSVDETVSVDGVALPGVTSFTPPPNPTFNGAPGFRSASGHWPATVTCATGPPDACTEVGKPAVIPGETTVAFWIGWAHGTVAQGELAGTYVFTFTVHGTLNGAPVHVTASSKKIVMT